MFSFTAKTLDQRNSGKAHFITIKVFNENNKHEINFKMAQTQLITRDILISKEMSMTTYIEELKKRNGIYLQ